MFLIFIVLSNTQVEKVLVGVCMMLNCFINLLSSFLQILQDGEGDTNNDSKNAEDWEEVGEDFSV